MSDYLGMSAASLLEAFAATDPGPAAGSAAALTGAVAAALVGMVAKLTLERATAGPARLRDRYGPYAARAEEIVAAAGELRSDLQALAQEDAEQVQATVTLLRERAANAGELTRGSVNAAVEEPRCAEPPAPQRIAVQALQVAEYAAELMDHGYQTAAPDAGAALGLALAAVESAVAVTIANLKRGQDDPKRVNAAREESATLLARTAALRERFIATTAYTISEVRA
ncbi:MAG: cyclodeaminase/cyclohydrolase family protein [Actinomycetota bacterium]